MAKFKITDNMVHLDKEITKLDVSEKDRIKIIALLGEYNFRLIQGANERIQVEAFLAQLAAQKN